MGPHGAAVLRSEEQKETRNEKMRGKQGETEGGRDRQDGWTDGGRWKKLKRTRESDQGWNNVEREEMGDGKDGDK